MDYYILLKGKASIPQELSIGNNYKIVAEGAITEEKKSDKDDGDFIITYKFEPILVEIENDKGQRIKAKDTRSTGQRLRARCYVYWKENNVDMENERFYEMIGNKIIARFDEVMEFLKS